MESVDVSPTLIIISPLITGQLLSLTLGHVIISSSGVGALVHSLTSSQLHTLELRECTISSSDYCHLTTAISNSSLKHFKSFNNYIDEAVVRALARALTHTKTLEEVVVWELDMSREVARTLVEAMNNSSVKKLKIGWGIGKHNVAVWSFPRDRVTFLDRSIYIDDGDSDDDSDGDSDDDSDGDEIDSEKKDSLIKKINDQYMEVVKDHISKYGSINIGLVKTLFIGPCGVGKTVTMKRLTGKIRSADSRTRSTVIEKPLAVPLHKYCKPNHKTVVIGDWEAKDLWNQAHIIFDCIQATPVTAFSSTEPVQASAIVPEFSEAEKDSIKSNTISNVSLVHETHTNSDNVSISTAIKSSDVPSYASSAVSQVESPNKISHDSPAVPVVKAPVVSPVDYIFQELGIESFEAGRQLLKDLENVTFLHIYDIGGQPEIHEVLPLLLPGPALSLLFFSLDKDLNDRHMISFRYEDESKSYEYKSEITTLDFIYSCLSNIDFLHNNDLKTVCPFDQKRSDKECRNRKPTALLVGTFLDKLKRKGGSLKTFENSIQNRFGESNFAGASTNSVHVLRAVTPDKYIIPIDNTDDSLEDIKELRKQIEAVVRDRFSSVEIPVNALLFHIILQLKYDKPQENAASTSDEIGWCRLQTAREIASKCGITEELEDVLGFFHNEIGAIRYYNDIDGLKDKVICDANLVLKPFHDIIAFVYQPNAETKDRTKKIRSTGEITHEEMESVCTTILKKGVVDLFKKCYIIEEISTQNKAKNQGAVSYLMPCLLQACDQDSLLQPLSKLAELSPAPLLFIPSGNHVPRGLFLVLVVMLAKGCDNELVNKDRFRNKVTFAITDEGIVVELRMLVKFIELRVLSSKASSRELVSCRQVVADALSEVSNLRPFRSLEWHLGFYCEESPSHPAHPAKCHKNVSPKTAKCPKIIRCVEEERKCHKLDDRIKLEPKHKIWFEDSDHGTDQNCNISLLLKKEPELAHLMVWLNSIKAHAKILGTQLGVPEEEMTTLHDLPQYAEQNLTIILDIWKNQMTSPHTFEQLFKALEAMKKKRLIRDIKNDLLEYHYNEYYSKPDYRE